MRAAQTAGPDLLERELTLTVESRRGLDVLVPGDLETHRVMRVLMRARRLLPGVCAWRVFARDRYLSQEYVARFPEKGLAFRAAAAHGPHLGAGIAADAERG